MGNRISILKFIRENPGCSFTDIHYDIRIDVKNVMVSVQKMEKEGIVIIDRPIKGKKAHGKVKCYIKTDIKNNTLNEETKQPVV